MEDARIRQVQVWLNEQYGGNPAWGDNVPVTGKTGWSTVYKLIRSLQWELGITALSNNFGAGTLSALATHGPVGASESNENIVRIVQGGLYCQGYDPGGFDGLWGANTASAVAALLTDMGLTPPSPVTISPKAFKGILTMNAYTLLAGGSSAVRSVQRWLNAKYLSRANFFISPADGLPSRDTQTNLIYALQYEIGMTDAVANGNFGPGTKTGLQAQGLFGVGATDTTKNFVRLFHAALIFNQVDVPFDNTLSTVDSAKVKEFQTFCILEATGTADFRTWSSLLVSTGDPDRPVKAVDTATEVTTPRAETLWGLGYRAVGRYLTNVMGGTLDKRLKDAEFDRLLQKGFSMFPIFQEVGNSVGAFSYAKGQVAARRAFASAYRLRMPAGTTIYFAVDFDPTGDEISGAVIPYFQGIASVMGQRGGRYKVGAYGTRNVCRQLDDADLGTTSFVAGMSTGYSGNLGFALPRNWAFDQIQEKTVGTGTGAIGIDRDVMSGRDPGLTSRDPEVTNDGFLRMLDLVWMEAVEWAGSHAGSPPASQLVCHFYRRSAYNDIAFAVLMGDVDQDFVSHVVSVLEAASWDPDAHLNMTILHPDYANGRVEAAHLFAAMNGYLWRGIPADGGTPDTADIGGWAGDLISVLNGYQQAVNDGYAGNLADYADATVLVDSPALSNRFGLADFVEDCTGFSLANGHSVDPSRPIPTLVREALSTATPRETCFMRFWRSRTHESSAAAEALGAKALAADNGTLFNGARALLLEFFKPSVSLSDFPEDQRAAAGRIFGNKMLALRA